jgi:hypothetical protein
MQIYSHVIKQGSDFFNAFLLQTPQASDDFFFDTRMLPSVDRLNEIRDEAAASASSESPEVPVPDSANRVDTTLNDVSQLLSLFLLRIGKVEHPMATYCQLSTMKVSPMLRRLPCLM